MATSSPPESQQYVDFDEYVDFQLQKIRKQVRTNDILFASVSLMSSLVLYLLGFTLFDQWIVPGGFSYGLRVTLLLLFAIGMSIWLWIRIWRPYRQQVNALYAARVIENAVPSLKSRLMTLIDFRSTNRQPDPSIVKAIEKQTAVRLAKADLEEAVNHQPLLRASYFFLGVLFLFFLYMMLSPKDILPSIWRALLPPAEVAVATETKIESVKPGSTTVYEFSELNVSVELSGRVPEQVVLYYSTLDETYVDEPVKLRKTEDVLPTFNGRVLGENGEGIRQAFTYYVVAGDIRSEEYQVDVIAPPEITFDSVSISYPKYMQLPVKKQSVGHLDEWEGSTVRLSAHSNVEIKSAEAIFSDDESFETKAEQQRLKVTNGKTISGEWKLRLRTDGTYPRFYRLQCQTEEGEKNRNPVTYRYRIRPDEAPVIQLIDPTEDIERPANAVVPLMFKAEDPDFRLSSVRIFVEKNGEQIYRQTILDSPRKKVEGIYQLSLKKLALRPGEVISYRFEAEDNKQPEHNKKKSGSLKITVTDRVKQREADKQLKEDKQRQRELHEQLKEQEEQEEQQNSNEQQREEQENNKEQTEEQQEQNKGAESSSEEQSSGGESSESQSADGSQGAENSDQENQSNEDQKDSSEESSEESSAEGTEQSKESSADGTDPSEQSESGSEGEQNSDQEQPLDPTSQEDQAEALQKINDYLKEQQQKQEESQQQKQDANQPSDNSKENQENQQPQENSQGEPKPEDKQEQGGNSKEEQQQPNKPGASEQQNNKQEENKSGSGESDEKQQGAPQNKDEEQKQAGSENQKSGEEQAQNQPGSNNQEQNASSNKNEQQQSDSGSEKENNSQNSSSQQNKSESKPQQEGNQQKSDSENSDANPQGSSPKSDSAQDQQKPEQSPESKNGDKKQDSTNQQKSNQENQNPTDKNQQQAEKSDSEKNSKTGSQKPEAENGKEKQSSQENKQPEKGQPKEQSNDNKEKTTQDPMKSEKNEGASQKKNESTKQQDAAQKKEQQQSDQAKEDTKPANEQQKKPSEQTKSEKAEDKPEGEQPKMKDGPSKQEKSDEPPPMNGVPKEKPDPNAKKMEGEAQGTSDEEPQGQKEGKSSGEKTDKAPPEQKKDSSKQQAEGSEQDSSQPQESPDAQPRKQGSKPSPNSPKGGEAPKGEGSGNEGSGDPSSIEEAEKANEEFAKQAAELILKKLDKQIKRGEVDKDLLEKLGWNETQLKSFSESLKKQLSQPKKEDKRSKANQSQFLEMLKSLNLKNNNRSVKGNKINKFDQTGLGSQRTPVPEQYQELLEEFNRSQSRRSKANRP